ncbi:MAG TPA: hypothetical protein V6D22_13695 [Candidatus Obscuribacterales bacterium]
MIGINIEALAKSEIAKVEAKLKAIDADHDGLSDLAEAEKLVSEAVADLKVLEAKVSPAEMAAALNVLFPGKFNAAEIASAEAAVGKILSAISHAAGMAKAAQAVL